MGKLKVTIEHGNDRGPIYVGAMIAGGLLILAMNAQAFMGVVGAGIAIAAYWLCGLVGGSVLLYAGVRSYTMIRDRPVYNRMAQDIASDLIEEQMKAIKNPSPTKPLRVQSDRGPGLTPVEMKKNTRKN